MDEVIVISFLFEKVNLLVYTDNLFLVFLRLSNPPQSKLSPHNQTWLSFHTRRLECLFMHVAMVPNTSAKEREYITDRRDVIDVWLQILLIITANLEVNCRGYFP